MDVAPATLPRGKAGMRMNEMNIYVSICKYSFTLVFVNIHQLGNEMNIYVSIHRCLKVLSWRVTKFLRRLELSNTNLETGRNDLPNS